MPAAHRPVLALVSQAETQAGNGQLDSAAGTLERAIRIDGQDASTWYQLAQVNLAQGRADDALAMARKSIALSGTGKHLESRNWRLVAQAHEQNGNMNEAATALGRARALKP